ncbi:hypothetical protein CONPUDRAFT_125965 [Coniophora puteana RWD-64-598 SS2]|uniref:F-box domain-containing protein n=1 Tax=Coniophora puteana (strain RWD-64-598) TaxID=741705 RepID=A0A5M3MLZ4_CONPW|nr:uncharacterized protein CONPUDRAFT_125965 [Coniophora puteana RWD-64-598 SS2]EIW79601.1 hypothetical protein CONPUDRAFT_125965 [Coniophora puteana RWD-64-598 SS2]
MTVSFVDLPIELLPFVVESVVKPQHLAALCLVDRTFNAVSTARLYERVVIYAWYREAKERIRLVFRTLAEHPHLARHVHSLELRDFPKSLSSSTYTTLHTHVLAALAHCTNLRACTWTRDGSLDDAILSALHTGCPRLAALEINGNDGGYYDPRMLTHFTALERLALVMPSPGVVDVLPVWMAGTGAALRNLTLICKASTSVTDDLLLAIAPALVRLEHLYITGCPKVTHRGIIALVASNTAGLISLGLEGLSQSFDTAAFNTACARTSALRRLASITLTVHTHTPLTEWTARVQELLWDAPLESFQVYATGAFVRAPGADAFWAGVVARHGARLRRFSAHRVHVGLAAVREICAGCPRLERMFIVAEQDELETMAEHLSHARSLRAVHVTFPMNEAAFPQVLAADALLLAKRCAWSVSQVGCNTKVWHVKRSVARDAESGEWRTETSLGPYENPDIPEPFLVIRA